MIRPAWTPATIALMVLGFVVFWPLGLAMLAYILWGDRFHEMARDAKDQWRTSPMKDAVDRMGQTGFQSRTGNVAFDEYRERELKRLEEERAKLDAMRSEFDEFLRDLRRARDQEEFDRFMSDRGRGPSPDMR
ncbi:membrane protein [Roseibium aquae]|uniref:Membrane protein n=2 Tax=Roseibium aquae TaxID=1323746 RepID=A0A916TCZ4_9HYPH|nr:membrane protein [Roseibium aquae]